jgi:O-methyltransferase
VSKRRLAARLFRKPVETFDLINYSVRFEHEVTRVFQHVPKFDERFKLHEHVGLGLAKTPVDYLEFGVWQGATIKKWLSMNSHPQSRFVGFDSFEGLPEDWVEGQPRGTFSTGGVAPRVDDTRGQFVVGWFQNTLYEFLRSFSFDRQLVVHIDCDLYSSTLFVLGALDRHLSPGTVIIFDDFSSLNHEFAAWLDYRRSYSRTWKPLAMTTNGLQAAVQLEK